MLAAFITTLCTGVPWSTRLRSVILVHMRFKFCSNASYSLPTIVRAGSVHVGFVVDKVPLRHFFLRVLLFFHFNIIPLGFHTHISHGGWTIGPLVTVVQRHSLISSTWTYAQRAFTYIVFTTPRIACFNWLISVEASVNDPSPAVSTRQPPVLHHLCAFPVLLQCHAASNNK
jgi:hypothetical protein